MKKLLIVSLAIFSALCSCNGNKTEKGENSTKDTIKKSPQNIIRTPLQITSDFNQITSIGGIDIIYTQGDFSAELEGDSLLLPHIDVDIDSGILSISMKGERNHDINIYEGKNGVKLYLSSPNLKCVALCSSGNFTSKGTWTNEDIQLGIIGKGSFKLDSINCKTFKYQTSGTGNADFKNIKGEQLEFICTSKSDVTATVDADYLKAATNNGVITLNGKAKQKQLSASKDELIKDNTTR